MVWIDRGLLMLAVVLAFWAGRGSRDALAEIRDQRPYLMAETRFAGKKAGECVEKVERLLERR